MNPPLQPEDCLSPSFFIDSDHPEVWDFALKHRGENKDPVAMAQSLYLKVRDSWWYDPYKLDFRPDQMKASSVLGRTRGHCVEKATLYAAACRVVGIPSRLRFANVRNHIGVAKLEEYFKTNLLVFHGFAEVFLNGQWRKVTPAFNKELCAHLNVAPLEFNGVDDSVFQEFDAKGGKFMEYEHDYGPYADLPREEFIFSLKKHYGHLFDPSRAEQFGLLITL